MLTHFHRTILEMIAQGEAVEATADHLCRSAERIGAGILCSMVTVDRAGHLHPFAGPSLPREYSAALDGIPIGPEVGSCGSAAFLRESVAVTDIFTDLRWAPYRAMAEPLGVKACWSSPILGRDARVIGAFGFYFRDGRRPNADEEHLVAGCTDLASILIDQQDLRAENHRLTAIDSVTGLGNRACFEKAIAAASRGGRKRGLLLIDIDRLRCINKDFGYGTGDLLIRAIGRRLRDTVLSGQAFRTGGGEFAVLLDDADPTSAVSRTARQILAAMRAPAWCGSHVISPVVTCGGATLPLLQPDDGEMLWRHADLALRHAKEEARGRFIFFQGQSATAIARRMEVFRITTRALADDRLEAHYQPVVDLSTREVIGLEALCRVRTPQGHVVPAGSLAPAMTAQATASLVTDRMLTLVAQDIRRWIDQGIGLQHVGVNLSMEDFRRDDMCERLVATFSRHDVQLSCLVLEVTEAVCLDDDDRKVVGAVERLRATGMRIALDDFGTGYASLTHLLSFPADMIKADKSVVDRLSPDGAGEVILKAMLDISRGLGKALVVEGVETAAQAAHLERIGCKLAQGFLFGRPMTAAAISEMLQDAGQRRSFPLYPGRQVPGPSA